MHRWLVLLLLLVVVPPLAAQPSFDELFERHQVVMLLIEPESGQIVDANPAAVTFYGYSRDLLRGMTIDRINTFTPEQVYEERLRAAREHRNNFIFRHRLADERVRTVAVISQPYDFAGQPLLLSSIHDITDLCLQSDELWHYQLQLERQVDAQVAQMVAIERRIRIGLLALITLLAVIIAYLFRVNRLRRRAEQVLTRQARELTRVNADLTRLADISAHHLMEPARRQLVYSRRLRRLLATDDPDLSLHIDFIEQAADRQRALVLDIQRYLAAITPREPIREQDTTAVMEAVLRELQPLLSEKAGRVDLEPLPSVMLDRPRLHDLCRVLLENGLIHSHPGRPPHLRIRGERTATGVIIRIADNGPGLEPAFRERVFELFERHAGNHTGTGIGLAIARRIVESRNGRIWLEEADLGGLQVGFELPEHDSP